MCIAILNTAGLIPEEFLYNSYQNNPDGNGLIFAYENVLYTYKTFNYEEFLSKYYDIRNRVKTPIVLHFRMATHGNIDLENCHPFKVNKNLAFVHNGIISKYGNANYSDTYCYNEQRLKTLQNNFLRSRFIREFIAKEIGRYSKLIFMDNYSNYTIINEQAGIWDENNWYSNNGYRYTANYSYDDSFNYFDDDYFIDFYGEELPLYYDKLTDDEKTYLFDLIDLGYTTPPDLDSFLFDYSIYTATVEENSQQLELLS